MKYLLILAILFLSSCNPNEFIKHIGKPDHSTQLGVILDGGSLYLDFTNFEGNKVTLYLDQSMEITEVEKGHLYWGYENFKNRKKLDYMSPLAIEILKVIKEDYEDESTGYFKPSIKPFIDKLELEQNKNKL